MVSNTIHSSTAYARFLKMCPISRNALYSSCLLPPHSILTKVRYAGASPDHIKLAAVLVRVLEKHPQNGSRFTVVVRVR